MKKSMEQSILWNTKSEVEDLNLGIDNPIPFGKARTLENMHKICGAKVRKTIFYSSLLCNLVILSATILI